MATFQKFDQFVADLANGVHNFASDQFTVALCNAANAPVAGNSVIADLTEIVAYTNLSSRNLTVSANGQVGGVFSQLFADLVLSAAGGAVAPFRYVIIFNNTPSSPLDPLVDFYDYGSDLTLNDGESVTLDFTTATFTLS